VNESLVCAILYLASISTERSSPDMTFTQAPNFPAIHAAVVSGIRALITRSRDVSLFLAASVSGLFRPCESQSEIATLSISAPIHRIDPASFPSHPNRLSRFEVRAFSFRGNPG
jgi:hypothetical protein